MRGRRGQAMEFDLAYTGAGWLAGWSSLDEYGGTIGKDFDIFLAAGHEYCPPSPFDECKVPAFAGSSRLKLRAQSPYGGKLVWKWVRGETTTPADLGDPSAATDYAVCVYDSVGPTPVLVDEFFVAAGSMCGKGTVPCWDVRIDDGILRYKDRDQDNGPVKLLDTRSGASGHARIKLVASGRALPLPPLPMTMGTSVTVQLVNLESGACWQNDFTDATRSDDTNFVAAD